MLRQRFASVTFIGSVEDVRPYMASARIALVPDELGGFKLKGLDYVFSRLPVLAMCWAGEIEAGEKAVAPLRALGKPIADVIGPMPYAGWQSAFDPLLAPGARNYWKSHDFTKLDDGFFRVLLEAGNATTGEQFRRVVSGAGVRRHGGRLRCPIPTS